MIHFITKPQTKKRGIRLINQLQEKMGDTPYLVHYTKQANDGQRIARELTAAGETQLVVIGGDGMLNDVLSGIENPSACALGLIPFGTGNDFAASARIPESIAALDIILQTQPLPTDYMQFADGRRSLNIAGLGLDVDILTRCYRAKVFHGKIKYFLSLLSSLCHFKGCSVEVTVHGQTTKHNALIVAVCNGKRLGGGIPLCPPALIDDGKMELMIVDQPKRRKLLGALIKLMRGKVLSIDFAHRVSCENAIILPQEPCLAQFDGELYPVQSLNATLCKGGICIYRPV